MRKRTMKQIGAGEGDAGDAAELLYRKIVRIEASAQAARTALDELPYLRDPHARRVAARAYELVHTTAEEAEEALEVGERIVARLAGVTGADEPRAAAWGFLAAGWVPA
jgi:hypothetical protein